MKKALSVILIIILALSCVLMLASCALIGVEKNYLAIQDDGTYFDMSVNRLKNIKGEPIEIEKDFGDTPFDEYVFQETIHGYSARSTYVFWDEFLFTRLVRAHFSFEEMDYAAAKSLAEKMYTAFSDQYSARDGFYSDGFTEENGAFEGSMGVNFGATGIECSFSYADGKLHVFLHNQV